MICVHVFYMNEISSALLSSSLLFTDPLLQLVIRVYVFYLFPFMFMDRNMRNLCQTLTRNDLFNLLSLKYQRTEAYWILLKVYSGINSILSEHCSWTGQWFLNIWKCVKGYWKSHDHFIFFMALKWWVLARNYSDRDCFAHVSSWFAGSPKHSSKQAKSNSSKSFLNHASTSSLVNSFVRYKYTNLWIQGSEIFKGISN